MARVACLFLIVSLALTNCGRNVFMVKQRVDNSLNRVVNTVANTSLLSSNTGELYYIFYRWHSPDAHVVHMLDPTVYT